jgi:hypothetical protein
VCTQVDYCVCDLSAGFYSFASHNKKERIPVTVMVYTVYYILPIVVPCIDFSSSNGGLLV